MIMKVLVSIAKSIRHAVKRDNLVGRYADDFYSIRRECEKFAAGSIMMYDSSPAKLLARPVAAD